MSLSNTLENPGPIVLMGAALDTSNLGCSALSLAVISGISRRHPTSQLAVGDFGRGFRVRSVLSGTEEREITLFGSVNTYRLYRTDSIYGMAICSALGGLGHPVIRLFRAASAVLDISGGDSFSDIYGMKFFKSNTLRKQLALKEGKSLILLPQTYGPYKSRHALNVSESIVRRCAMAWARDARSFEVLRDLLGDSYDPARHRLGVDVAFALPTLRPAEELITDNLAWFEESKVPIAGFNVSGLLYNRSEQASIQYGFKANYRDTVLHFLERFLQDSNARLLLVPHVVPPVGHFESDVEACQSVASILKKKYADRVATAPVLQDPCEVKWIISKCDWFCGTRMHSTIAALSSGVPTAGIGYSPKTLGVFETCEQGTHVVDLRNQTTEEIVDHLIRSWTEREASRGILVRSLPAVKRQAESQMDEIAKCCLTSSPLTKV